MSANKAIQRREQEIDDLISKLTLDEKIGMIHGAGLFRTAPVPRLGIPALKMSDGPMGVRAEMLDKKWKQAYGKDDMVTYLPSNSAIAATWNPKLARKCGEILGEEARGRGKDVILAPGINIKRSPLCGRNFEYMSEDPYLVSEMTVPLIEGIQKNDVASCVKHFAANGQETNRLWVDTIVDERTLNEIYFPGFEAAVKQANVYSIMGAYNLLNGEHCCQSNSLLREQLRDKWEYDGTVISDWGGVHDTRTAAESPLDIEMSVTYDFDEYKLANPLKDLIMEREIKEEVVDEKVRNILRLMYRLNMMGDGQNERKSGCYHSFEHMEDALKVARESVILLKNEENILPFKCERGEKIAVIGHNAAAVHSNGGGSAEIKSIYEVTPLLALRNILGGNVDIRYTSGYFVPPKKTLGADWQENSLESVAQESFAKKDDDNIWYIDLDKEKIDSDVITDLDNEENDRSVRADEMKAKRLRAKALRFAKLCKKTVLFVGLNHDYDTEGIDKDTLKLPYQQDELIEAVLDVNPDAVIVIMAGAPVEMPWIDKAKTVLFYYYSGIEGATAVAEVIAGKINPSGKLPETFPKCTEDVYPVNLGEFGKSDKVVYKDGIYVGYRYYESFNKEVNFCFGHGISYTEFKLGVPDVFVGNNFHVELELPIRNSGKMKGKETVQVYIRDLECSVDRPVKELAAFKKVQLKPGESDILKFVLDKRAFSFYDVETHSFKAEPGEFEISIGCSVKDIRHKIKVVINN